MRLVNKTPFVIDRLVVLDKDGAEQLVVIAKATFTIGERSELSVAAEQQPVQYADEFYGEPGLSSIQRASEANPPKPGTDVLLFGHAKAMDTDTRSLDVRLRVGPIERIVRAFGPRVWRRFLGWWWTSRPEAFSKIPLTWEHAYGGTDQPSDPKKARAWEPRNPVGRGFRASSPPPSFENPKLLIRRPGMEVTPAGFGPIGRHWMPRMKYAGTYDDAWRNERVPLLPEDFDDRFHHCAPPELVSAKKLRGDEKVEIEGCTRDRPIAFRLPALQLASRVRLRSRIEDVPLGLDTVAIDTDAPTLVLVYAGMIRVHGEVPQIRWIELTAEGYEASAEPSESEESDEEAGEDFEDAELEDVDV